MQKRRTRSMCGLVPPSLPPTLDLSDVNFTDGNPDPVRKPLSARDTCDTEREILRLKKKHESHLQYDSNSMSGGEWAGLTHPPSDFERNENPTRKVHLPACALSDGGAMRRTRKRPPRRRGSISVRTDAESSSMSSAESRRSRVLEHACHEVPDERNFAPRVATCTCAGACSKRKQEFMGTLHTGTRLCDLPSLYDDSDIEESHTCARDDYAPDSPFMDGHDCLFRAVSFCMMCHYDGAIVRNWRLVERDAHELVAKQCRTAALAELGTKGHVGMPSVDCTERGLITHYWYSKSDEDELPSVLCQKFRFFANALGDMRYSRTDELAVLQCIASALKVCVIVLYTKSATKPKHPRSMALDGEPKTLPAGLNGVVRMWPRSHYKDSTLVNVSMLYDGSHYYPVRPKGDFGEFSSRAVSTHSVVVPTLCKVSSALENENQARLFIEKHPFDLMCFNIDKGTSKSCGKFQLLVVDGRSLYVCCTFGVCDDPASRDTKFYCVRRTRHSIPDNSVWNPERKKAFLVRFNRRGTAQTVGFLDVNYHEQERKRKKSVSGFLGNYEDSLRVQLESRRRLVILICADNPDIAEHLVLKCSETLLQHLILQIQGLKKIIE